MKNRLLSLFTVLAMVLTMIPTTAFAAGSSYDGSYEEGTMSLEDQFLDFRDNYVDTGATVSNDADAIPDNIIGSSAIPFYIGNSATLVELAELIGTDETYASYAYADAYYVMVADIDLGDTEWTAISDFDGTFDGATYSITSSVIEVDVAAGDKVGLFAADTTGVSNVTINYTGGTTGGESTGTTDVWNGSVATVFAESNQISSADELKLFANQVNDGTITSGTYTLTTNIDLNDIEWTPIGTSDKTPFTGTFDGDGYTISGLTITDSSTLSGLFGYVGEGGTVKNVHVEGDVSGTSNNVGGVVGYTYSGTVSNCYNTGNVSGSSQVGGVVGNDNGGTVSNCVALCQTVTASTSDGGRVVGTSSGNLTNNYAWSGMTVTVASATKTITAGTSEIDGASLTWSDTALSGITTSLDYWNDTSTLPNGDALPVYIIGAYIVSTQADLEAVADDLTGNYILVNDIKLTGEWTPIGDYSSSNSNIFTGTFDGDGYTISGLSINQSSSDYQGLFGYNTGTIKNLNVAGEVTGSQRVGGVVGYNKGTVEYCSSSVTVKSSDKYIGGVVGDNTNGTVQYCYNTGSVTGGDNTGGVVGWNNGTSSATVSNCYNIGTVEGTSNVGGVVGYNQSSNSKTATVEYCYNTGDVKGTSSIGGVVGYNNAVSGTATVSNCVALCATVTGPIGSTGRVVGEDSGTLEYNYALSTMKIGTSGSEAVVEENDTTTIATGTNGATVTYDATTGFSTSWDTMGFSTSDWTIPTSALYLPSLGLDGEALVSFATLEDATSNILTVTFKDTTTEPDTDTIYPVVSGEKLTSIPDAPSGYVWVDGDGNEPSTTTAITESITYTAKLIVATIGDTNYTSLQAAITAAGTTTTTTITLQADTTENITISSNVTIDLNGKTLTGTVTNNGTVIDGTYTITAAEDSSTTINTDGTMTLNAGATVQYGSNTTVVTVGENSTASYSSGSITVADDNYLTYGTTIITAGTVGVGYNEIGSESATVNGYEIKGFSGNGFSVSSTGKVTLTSGLFYSVEGVTISTADGDMTLDTTDNDGIALDNGTVVHGYTLTGGVITTNGVTATTAVYTSGNDTVTITGDLSVTEDGVKSTSGTFTVSYDEGVTSITLDEKATADKDGKVTANVIITGAYPDTVAYTADEGTNITIETTGVASYPSGTVITDGDYTITLGDEMKSTESYPANTTVKYGNEGDTITIASTNGGTINTSTDTITASKVTIGEDTTISVINNTLTVNATTGTTTVGPGKTATMGDLVITGGTETTISAAGVVSGAVSIKENNTTVSAGTGNTISTDETGNIIATEGDTIAQYNGSDVKTAVTVAKGSVEVTGNITSTTITMDSDDSLTYDTNTTITATGEVTLSYEDNEVGLPSGATVTTGDVKIELKSTGTVTSGGTVVANSVTVGGTTITAAEGETVSTTAAGETTATSATVNGYTIVGSSDATFTVSSAGTVTLTAESTYTVAGVEFIVPAGSNMTLATTDSTGITIAENTIVHGFTLTEGGKITDAGVTATKATKGDAVFTGDLIVAEDGLTVDAVGDTDFTVSYDGGTAITLAAGSTVDNAGKVTASEIKIGDVTYAATESDDITITNGVVTYPEGTEITYTAEGKTVTITLGEETTSTEIDKGEYPVNTTVEYGDNKITLEVDGAIDTANGTVTATQVTVNGTAIVSTSGNASVDIDTGVTTVTSKATVTTNNVKMTVTGGEVSATGAVTTATSIEVGNTTVSGEEVTATAAGEVTADVGDTITDTNGTTVTVKTGDVTVTSTAITMTSDDSLTYGSTTIKATGTVTLEDGVVGLPAGATATTDGVTITVASAPAGVTDTGTVVAKATTVNGVTITADDDDTVTTTANGETTSSSAVTISATDCADVKVAAGDLTSVSATGTITVEEVTIGDTVLSGAGTTITMGTSASVTLPSGGTIKADDETYTVSGTVTVDTDGDVTLTSGTTVTKDGLTITAATGTTINADGTMTLTNGATVTNGTTTVTVDGEATYTTDSTVTVTGSNALTYAGQTITLGTATVGSDSVSLTSGSVVSNTNNSVTLNAAGSVESDGDITSTAAEVNGTQIVSGDTTNVTVDFIGKTAITAAATVTPATGVTIALSDGTVDADGTTTVTAGEEATVTTDDAVMTITGGEVTTAGAVSKATSIEVGSTTVTANTGNTVSADETGEITAGVGNKITNADGTSVTVATGSGDVTIEDDAITMTSDDSLFYNNATITATGDVKLGSNDTIYLPSDATVTSEASPTIKLETEGTVNAIGTVTANSVTVGTTTITADGEATVTVDSGGKTTSSNAVTITSTTADSTTIQVAAGNLTSVTANGTITADALTITDGENDIVIAGTGVSVNTTTNAITIPAGGTITVDGQAFTVTNGATVTVDATTGEINIPDGTVLEKGEAIITVDGDTTISNTGDVTLPVGSTVSNATTGESVTMGAEGTYTTENVAESQKVTLSDGTTTTTITASSGDTVTVDVDNTGATATQIPENTAITDGSSTVTTVTENITVSADDGTINVPENKTIATQGMEITMGTDGSLTLSDSEINLPAGSVVQDTVAEEAPAITIAEGVTGATVNLVTDESQKLVAGTVSATKVTVGTTVLTSTDGNLNVTLEGTATFPMGGTVTTKDDQGNETVKNVSTNGSASVSGDGTMSYPSTGGGASSYTSKVSTSTNGSVSVSSGSAASGSTVTITATPDEGYEVATVTVTYASGREVTVTDNGDGTYSYLQPGATVTVTVTFVEEGTLTTDKESAFTDVSSSAYYYDAVLWAVEYGITSGYADDTFRPTEACTRAQAVTFLWRTAGCPEATIDNPFSDLDEDAYYYQAVLWAVENGVTTGYADGTFGADITCNRGAIVTFMYRLAGQPEVNGEAMSDVAEDDYCYDSVLWAVENGVTTGYSDGTFQASTTCNRGAIVTFLYRYLG